eukprot:scaffold131997_cov18-Prasinocladus_malaysianus.AAC.2
MSTRLNEQRQEMFLCGNLGATTVYNQKNVEVTNPHENERLPGYATWWKKKAWGPRQQDLKIHLDFLCQKGITPPTEFSWE